MTGDVLSAGQLRALDEDGFIIIEGVYSPADCRRMAEEFDRLHPLEGERGGHEVHVEPGAPRVSDIFNKTDVYDVCLECRELLAASHHMLGEFKLHGANLRDALEGQGHQDLHCDVPKKFPDDWWVTNGLVLFDDMTPDNGQRPDARRARIAPLVAAERAARQPRRLGAGAAHARGAGA